MLGRTGYQRDRAAEFADRGVPRKELEARIDQTLEAVGTTLADLTDAGLHEDYPLDFGGMTLSVGLFLTHLATHLAYHLGQIDYHRRVVTGQSAGVGAQSIPQLVER